MAACQNRRGRVQADGHSKLDEKQRKQVAHTDLTCTSNRQMMKAVCLTIVVVELGSPMETAYGHLGVSMKHIGEQKRRRRRAVLWML